MGVLAALAVVAGVAYVGRGWIFNNIPPRLLEPVLGAVFGFRVEHDVMIPMRDGIHLAANIYYPTRRASPLPSLS